VISDSKQSFFVWLFCDTATLMPCKPKAWFSATARPGNLPLGLPATLFPWSGAAGFPVRSATRLLAW